MVKIGDPDSVHPADLVAIARADPPSRRPDVVGLKHRLLRQPLLGQMIGKNDVRAVADMKPSRQVHPHAFECLDLLEQSRRVNHHAVADHAIGPRPTNPRRYQRQLVRHAVNHDGVPGIGPALVPHHHIVLIAKQIDDLPLRLVTPLQTNHTRRTHSTLSLPYSSRQSWSLGVVK
jgi:hypothetical protein